MTPTAPRALRASRIVVSALAAGLLTTGLVSAGMTLPRVAVWIAGIQFVPAAFSFSLTTIALWLIVTIILGRVYCSTVCPMGFFQDIFARIPRLGHFDSRLYYHYAPPRRTLQNCVLAVFMVCVLLGIAVVPALIDPYSAYARFCVYCLKPVYASVRGIVPPQAVMLGAASMTGVVTALATMGAVAWFAVKRGRVFCNTLCPVGTVLGYVSRYSIFRIDINTDKCIQCRKCEHACKAGCIDLISHVVDSSRCVVCFDCLQDCPNDAIHYTTSRHQLSIPLMRKVSSPLAGSAAGMNAPTDKMLLDRRAFLAAGLVMAATPVLNAARKGEQRLRGGLSEGQTPVEPAVPVTPPGVTDRNEFLARCTACGLCISHCPTQVLRPSVTQYGILHIMQPVRNYDLSYCAYRCTDCTRLCPAGALTPITPEEKVSVAGGLARVWRERCVGCGRCAMACQAEAITMQERIPVVDSSKCIGCGACQYVCPARPEKAIIVNGIS